jgi:hypothetical protein
MSWLVQMHRDGTRGVRASWNWILGLEYYKLMGINPVLINGIIEMVKTELGNTLAEG